MFILITYVYFIAKKTFVVISALATYTVVKPDKLSFNSLIQVFLHLYSKSNSYSNFKILLQLQIDLI